MKWVKKIQGGALQFVLFMGVAIAILLLSFVSLSYTHIFFTKKTHLQIEVLKSTVLGMHILLKNTNVSKDTIVIPLPTESPIQAKGKKDFWGIYERYGVTTHSKKNQFSKIALIGGQLARERHALYLKDNQRPLVVVGNSKIEGTAFLPQQGIRSGNIGGKSYYRKQLVYGRQKQSVTQLPVLTPTIREQLTQLIANEYASHSLSSNTTLIPLRHNRSFFAPTQVLEGDIITLNNAQLTGNILIRATQKIYVPANSQLIDVVLVAPEIEIAKGVKGSFQAIATKQIHVGKWCNLYYPSALVVYDTTVLTEKVENSNAQQAALYVDENTYIGGALVYLNNKRIPTTQPQVLIEAKAIIYGEIYCEKNLELKGEIHGSVYTDAFVARANGSIYQNHLFNGIIRSTKLPPEYAGLQLEFRNTSKAIGKWLY